MLNFISACWQAIKTKYKKFFPFVLTFFFCFSPLSASAAVESPVLAGYVNSFELVPVPSNDSQRVLRLGISLDGTTTNYTSAYDGVNFNYDTPYYNSVSSLYVGTPSRSFDFDFITDLYDYYVFVSFHSNTITDGFTFFPYRVLVREYNSPDSYDWVSPSFQEYYINTDTNHKGFSALFKLPNSSNSSFNLFRFDDNNKGSVGSDVAIQGLILAFEKDTSLDVVNSIVSAINNQTDFIVNGNDSTGGIVSQFQSNLNEFNSVINQFDDIENGFISDFTTSNDEIKSTLSDYQFTGNLLTCANWVTDKYMDFFDNSGDFKQYFIYPLIMGIALFFIGRGQVILGNLYRKPYDSSTHTVTTGYTERYSDGSKRTETYTRTTGKGGKLRK